MRSTAFGRPRKSCADRREAKTGCWCIYCRENRLRRETIGRIDAHRHRPRPVQDCRCQHCLKKRQARADAKYGRGLGLIWRCDCGCKTQGPRCGRCGTVPAWATPEAP